ncbi:helix-turn-helix domain containing protein [Streptomyces sp. APSN-46.1]|uniref:helix-turn-helix domain-containing protein n=1 Tax=Streptomyces sp. APSN-46.1 TaxID=2929049 RepID=UPI001FB4D650|nr:helix-turn-helix domain-containing protein [Streptomyces sp. APSN-46.1]MCJ1680199.1 helix-turn-helix domain containing protein [Streptomyces sp. APSN-46.1]
MYDPITRRRALELVAQGRSLNSVSKETGISRSALRAWQVRIDPLPRLNQVAACTGPADSPAYAYLLGLYLGDGCISPHPRGGHHLRIFCADAWPGLIDQCRAAITKVRPNDKVYVLQRQGCVAVTSYGRHWTCLFPQHGPGKKHERRIALEPWQQEIVDAHPWEFIRGLIHSDGCRITNWTVRNGKRYEYPRYFFTNRSADITALLTSTLDRLGVEWRQANAFNVSIARKASVALMDARIGPKY